MYLNLPPGYYQLQALLGTNNTPNNTLIRNPTLDIYQQLGEGLTMKSAGGTRLWCYKCKAITECKVSLYYNDSKGNFSSSEFKDLNWRERPRQCNICSAEFETYEIESSAIRELIELRKLMIAIKSSIKMQQENPTAISKFLKSLDED